MMPLHSRQSILAEPIALIGPNAITRMIEAATEFEPMARVRGIFTAAGIERYLDTPPKTMVDEREVAALHRATRTSLGVERAATVAWLAGWRTGEYLLAHRIPQPAQTLLKILPAPISSRLLLAAIRRNAWTFVGSGHLAIEAGPQPRITLEKCAICSKGTAAADAAASTAAGTYYAAVFERLFCALVYSGTRVREVACTAAGAPACVFEITRSGSTNQERSPPKRPA